jgi:hypothetical protein
MVADKTLRATSTVRHLSPKLCVGVHCRQYQARPISVHTEVLVQGPACALPEGYHTASGAEPDEV